MARIKIYPIRIHKFFPPENDLAVDVARMCVLIEDLIFEFKGYLANEIVDLDSISASYRQIYFIRNLFKTFLELKGAIEQIRKNTNFQKFLENLDPNQRENYNNYYQAFNEQYDALKQIRHDIGGHLKQGIIQEGLKRIDPFEMGLWEGSDTGKYSHYKFTEKIIDAALCASYLKDNLNATQGDLNKMHQSFGRIKSHALPLSSLIFVAYVKGMNLSL